MTLLVILVVFVLRSAHGNYFDASIGSLIVSPVYLSLVKLIGTLIGHSLGNYLGRYLETLGFGEDLWLGFLGLLLGFLLSVLLGNRIGTCSTLGTLPVLILRSSLVLQLESKAVRY